MPRTSASLLSPMLFFHKRLPSESRAWHSFPARAQATSVLSGPTTSVLCVLEGVVPNHDNTTASPVAPLITCLSTNRVSPTHTASSDWILNVSPRSSARDHRWRACPERMSQPCMSSVHAALLCKVMSTSPFVA